MNNSRCFNKYALFGVVVVLSVLFAVANSYAIKLGKSDVNFELSLEERYDDNVFLEPEHEKDDFITRIVPGVFFHYPFGFKEKHAVDISYRAAFEIFADFDDENHVDQAVEGTVSFDCTDFDLTFNDIFLWHYSRADTEFEDRILRRENTFSALFTQEFNKFSYDVEYENYLVDYHSGTYRDLDRDENAVRLTGYMEVRSKTKALLEGRYRNIAYDDAAGRDADVYSGLGGLTWEMTGKTTGSVKAGYQSKQYEDTEEDDFESGIVEFEISVDFTPKTTLELAYTRSGVESTFGESNYYTSDAVSAILTNRFAEKWTLNANGGFASNDYSVEDREDDILVFGLGIDYQVRDWASLYADYQYKERDSTFAAKDYERNLVTAGMKATF